MNSVASRGDDGPELSTCDYCGLPTRGPTLAGESVFCCYGCRFAAGITGPSASADPTLGPASALGLSVFFTMNVVMLTMALWSYAERAQSPFEIALRSFLRYGALAFSLPVLLLLGRPLISHALAGLRNRVFTTDLLLAVGVLAAFVLSMINTWRGSGHVYFEVGCVILVLVTLGRWLEAAGRSQASAALEQLERLVPDLVHRSLPGGDQDVPRLEMCVGDCFRVFAGERIPLDGIVLRGHGVIDEQFFTGESCPMEKHPGDKLLGGTLNLDGDLLIEATAPPSAGALGRLVAAVRTARLSKGRYQHLSDVWSQWFFPVISLVAILSLVIHGLRVDWDHGILTALSVILIACPCALALATPVAIWAALGTAARNGVLCRSGAALETLASIRALRWDKTGTLTTGTPSVRRLICEEVSELLRIQSLAVSLTRASNHIYSQSIHNFLVSSSVEVIETANARTDRSVCEYVHEVATSSATHSPTRVNGDFAKRASDN